MMLLRRTALRACVAAAVVAASLPASAEDEARTLTELDLALLGVSATVEDLEPVVPKATPSGVRIVVRAGTQELTSADVQRFLGGPFQVQAELSGPGLPGTLSLPDSGPGAAPVENLLVVPIPAIPVAGNYDLANIRIVVAGRVALDVEPQRITLKVIDQILVTQVTTRPLTRDEIREKGIVLDRDDYLGFEFNLGLLLDSQVVDFKFPVIFDRAGVQVPLPLTPPPAPPRTDIPLPQLRGVMLGAGGGGAEEDDGGPRPKLELPGGGEVRIPALLVIPGDVGYLKQFFSAKLYVANGAPLGSGLTIHDVRGRIKLPPGADGAPDTADDPLALPELARDGQVVTQPVEMAIEGVGLDGEPGTSDDLDTLGPTQQGQAEFLLRGEKEGFHTIDFDIRATLEGLPGPDGVVAPIQVSGKASGGVLVRNPYFDMTFTVPTVVRDGEEFKVFITVTNIGLGTANDFSLNLDGAAISGMTLIDEAGNEPTRFVPELHPRDSVTFEYAFLSQRTGQVIAKYLRLDGSDATGSHGHLKFTLGVGERGVPLSPDTLQLPASVGALPRDLVQAAMRVLGQAWSLAKAPFGTLPSGVKRVTPQVVVTKALAFAEAGLRVQLGEPQDAARRDLVFDWYRPEAATDSGVPDEGFDQLLRETEAGRHFARTLGFHLAAGVDAAGGALPYEDELAEIGAAGDDFISFAVRTGDTRQADVALIDGQQRATRLPAGASAPESKVPASVLLPLGLPDEAPLLGFVGRPAGAYLLELAGRETGSAEVSVTLPSGDGETFRRAALGGLELRPGSRTLIAIDPQEPGRLLVSEDLDGNGVADDAPRSFDTHSVRSGGPRLLAASVLGPETLAGASDFGFHAAVLYDRVVDAASGGSLTHYALPKNEVRFARRQLSGRIVFLQLGMPEGPYVPQRLSVEGMADTRGNVGPAREVDLGSRLLAPGGVVTGRVMNADGSPVGDALLAYVNSSDGALFCEGPPFEFDEQHPLTPSTGGLTRLDAAGTYELRYVRQQNGGCPFYVITQDPVTGAQRYVLGRVRGGGDRQVIDIVLIGRGQVGGTVRNRASGLPVAGAQVVALSNIDQQSGGQAVTDALGRYTISQITVGPVTVHAAKGIGTGFASGRIFRVGETATVNVELDDGALDISGRVTRLENGVSTPVVGGLAVVYYDGHAVGWSYTDNQGRYLLRGMPSGQFRINVQDVGLSASRTGEAFAGQDIENFDFVLQVPLVGQVHDVVGHVVYANGDPAGGAIAFLGSVAVLADVSGLFRIPNVSVLTQPPFNYTIAARSADGRRSGSTVIQLTTSGQNPEDALIRLSGLGSAQFTVLGPDNRPVSGLEVGLLGACANPCGCSSQMTDGAGVVRFENLAVGGVSVQAFRDRPGYVDFASASAAVPGDGETGFGVMRFNGAGTVKVKVVDADNNDDPVGGSRVTLQTQKFVYDPIQHLCGLGSVDLSATTSITSGTPGEVQFKNVLVGGYSVSATNPFAAGAVLGDRGTIAQDAEIDTVLLRTRNVMAGVLSGTVYLPDGSLAGAGVSVTVRGPVPDYVVETNSQGQYHFARVLPAGGYTLTARDPDLTRGLGVAQDGVYLAAGRDVTFDVRLKGRGAVRALVVDSNDEPVERATVTLRENVFPSGVYQRVIEQGDAGLALFNAVYAGGFSVDVKDSLGRGGRASGTLPAAGQTVEVTVRVTPTGCVRGRFLMPDGQTPIPFGTVKLLAGPAQWVLGQATTSAGQDAGRFEFDYVPLGNLRLEAQDPVTARNGLAAAALEVESHLDDDPPQCLALDVLAEGLGTVFGGVTANGDGQPGIEVEVTSGNYRSKTFSDHDGNYRIEGVPVGQVTARANPPGGYLTGSNAGTLAHDGDALELDVALRDSATLAGEVRKAGGLEPAPVSELRLSGNGISPYNPLKAFSDAAGAFLFERVPVGTVTLDADVLQSIDRGRASVDVQLDPNPPVVVTLNGVGRLQGTARDSLGNPVAGTLWITGTGAFPYQYYLTAPSNGVFELPEVLAGPVSVRLQAKPGSVTLYGTASGTIDPEGLLLLDVRLQDSGTVRGRILRADGQTPAYGADVTLRRGFEFAFHVIANTAGEFVASGIPLGAFVVDVRDPVTGGLATVGDGQLTTNGQELDLGDLVLDDTLISVVSITPPNGSLGVPIHQPIQVVFSDTLAGPSGVYVRNGTGFVGAAATLSADRRAITLTGVWPDSRDLVVQVTTAVRDSFGRPLPAEVTSTFRTVDLTPPAVSSVTPLNQAIQVPPDAVARATFNEPLLPTADYSGVVVLKQGTSALAGSLSFEAPATLAFTPASPLALDAAYTLTVQGGVDLSGNLQTAAFTSSFKTLDTVPPALSLSAPPANGWTTDSTPSIAFALSDATSGIDPATGSLSLDGQTVAASVSSAAISFVPSVPQAEGQHSLVASIADRAGNSNQLTAAFGVDSEAPSAATLTGVVEGQRLSCATTPCTVPLTGSATDATSGVARVDFLRDGALLGSATAAQAFQFVLNPNVLSEGYHDLSARAVDVAGNVGPAGASIRVLVDNHVLTVSFSAPTANLLVRDNVTAAVGTSEPVQYVDFQAGSLAPVRDTTAPYEVVLDLAGAPEGTLTLRATAVGQEGESGLATRDVRVDRTPPNPPDVTRISAEPPASGLSLVFGRAGAVEASARVEIANTANGALANVTAGVDGAFTASLAAAVDDALTLVAVDAVGNRSPASTVVVRSTPSLPPSQGTTSLQFEGLLADRVGPGAAQLSGDGLNDALFTVSVSIGQGITRQLAYFDLAGPTLTRSTRTAVGSVLGVAADPGAPFLNGTDGQVGFPITSGATLSLYAADLGFIQPGGTYTVTAAFTDGSRFVGTHTIVAPEDRTQVAHSALLAAVPSTVLGTAAAPGTAILTVSDIRDIDGTRVPDGSKVALAVADMASRDPRGNPLRSAGGAILDGEPAPNNAAFKVFTVSAGQVTATYSSEPVDPAAITGALALVQVQAADAAGNVLGTEAIATLDLNLRRPGERAVVFVPGSSLYGDKSDRRVPVRIEIRDAAGNLQAGTTHILVTATASGSVVAGFGVSSAGGAIVGGAPSPTSSIYRFFTTTTGIVDCEYSSQGVFVNVGSVDTAAIQVLDADSAGNRLSTAARGTARVAIAGPAAAEIEAAPESVPLVFPIRPVQVRIHHVHDTRTGLVPDGAQLLVTATASATVHNGFGVSSAGGSILEGTPSPTSSIYKVLPLAGGEIAVTYSTDGVSASPGQTVIANVQLAMGDATGVRLSTTAVSFKGVRVVAPTHAVGLADPPNLAGDGKLRTSDVTFRPVLDAVGNPLPDGSKILATVASGGAVSQGFGIPSAGGQILNGDVSPTSSIYKVLTVADGAVTAVYSSQDITSAPGQVKVANLSLLASGPNGERLSTTALGTVGVTVSGVTTGTMSASPPSLHADGSDRRSTVTLSGLLDASGQAVPDGTLVALTATSGASVVNGFGVPSFGGQILGGTPSPTASFYRVFEVTDGQIVCEYSASGVTVSSGQQTATVQVVAVGRDGTRISTTAIATLPIPLVAPAAGLITSVPSDLLADGSARLSQVTIDEMLDAAGNPLADGSRVALTAVSGAATSGGFGIASAGGALLSAGVTPGDGAPAGNNGNYRIFTVAGGEVRAAYSAEGLKAGVSQTLVARISLVPASSAGNVLSTVAVSIGTVNLRGTTSATASGPASLSRAGAGQTGTVTFSGIKDSAGNTVPDGTPLIVTVASCGTVNGGFCVTSVGGTILDGTTSPSGGHLKVFAALGGQVTATYSTVGSSGPGTASVQVQPAASDGTRIGSQVLSGGIWAIQVTP